MTALARGFSSWTDFDGNAEALDGSAAQIRLAYAYSGTPVDEPADAASAFSIHDSVGRWVHDFAAARSDSFAEWVERNTISDPVPTPPPPAQNRTASAAAGFAQRALGKRSPLNGTAFREERHPVIPQLRDSAKFIDRRRQRVNETARS